MTETHLIFKSDCKTQPVEIYIKYTIKVTKGANVVHGKMFINTAIYNYGLLFVL